MKKLLTVLLALMLLVPAYGLAEGENDYDPFGAYDSTIVITQGRDSSNTMGEGWVLDDNPMTDAVFKAMNIRLENDWTLTGDELTQKIDLVLATGDLPDIMIVNSIATVKSLYEKGYTQDLTEAIKYLSPYLQEVYASYENNRNLESVTVDGQLLAIPNTLIGGQNNNLWLRRDWLENLGLEEPKTLEDVMNIAKAFIEQDPDGNSTNDTVGIAFSANRLGVNNSLLTIDPIFGVYGAYPRAWLSNEDGTVSYGSVTNEMKEAVNAITQYTKQGLIYVDPEPSNVNDLIVNGKCGMFFGPWWSVWDVLWGARDADSNADWFPYSAPLNAEGHLTTALEAANNQYLVVKKDVANPEAVVKILNMQYELYRKSDYALSVYEGVVEDIPMNFTCWPINIQLEYYDALARTTEALRAAIEADDKEMLPLADQYMFDSTKIFMDDPQCGTGDWSQAVARYYATIVAVQDFEGMDQAIYALTPSMSEKYRPLAEYEAQMLHDIFAGTLTVDDFDKFVEQWYSMGGTELIAEINEFLK